MQFWRQVVVLGVAATAVMAPRAAGAQGAVVAAAADTVGVEPITCWWRTGSGAVRIGELFPLVLTCAVLETRETSVTADASQLDPAVLQMAPFQVVDGVKAADIRSTLRRFFQYEYTLRVIDDDVAGTDVTIPALTIKYRVQTRVSAGAAAIEGRDRDYVLPALPMRVLSLVPAAATGIRDQPGVSFRAVDGHEFRADAYRIGALALYVTGVLVLLATLVQGWRRRRGKSVQERALVTDSAIVHGVRSTLAQLQRERATAGWTPDILGRMLATLRVAACYVLPRRPVQVAVVPGEAPTSGQLLISGGRGRRREARVSGGITGEAFAAANGNGNGTAAAVSREQAARRQTIETAIGQLTRAVYSRDDTVQHEALDPAVRDAYRVVEQLDREHGLGARTRGALVRRGTSLRERLWAR